MTPLGEKLMRRIVTLGPMTIADYMGACLGDPEHGYYMTRDPFGAAGDFVTAPEISQMFGELIGAWAVETWRRMGRPASFVLAELGPGRGTLMADLLRAARLDPAFEGSARLCLVETSPRLRDIQANTLSTQAVEWFGDVGALPPGPAIIVANELFDALPVRQFIRTNDGWAERMVGTDGNRLIFGLRDATEFQGADERLHPGSVVEIAGPASAIMTVLAARLASAGGAFLAIDYGSAEDGVGDTLQAVREHAFDDPLATPGEADLTVHVNFPQLAAVARASGAETHPILTQGEFLVSLGLIERAGRLGASRDRETQETIRAAVERLAGPEGMGTLFKVLVVSEKDLLPPPFDEGTRP